ncbi:hypothetical protein TSUD_194140 [Trifolium subterraneum]|uniref:Reverse transcriptase zinc-binding domain-containing protein n=1 Tax=Trifolium subterraneum TaxID=3900 RepID=A0A2Z6PL71_TRISU|nr:hypothetical protein TSUD_194140 [Trifolium subterraneum]
MHPNKAPGPDGFNPAFYQHFWEGCLDKCVSEEQSAFIEGRSILENALIAIEVIHALKRRTRGMKGELALKIDISKAYDKVDWGFMRVGPIYPGRGLRQGDPLSPYLFILVTEGLTTLIKRSTIVETNHLVEILKTYKEVTGQEINMSKSEEEEGGICVRQGQSMETDELMESVYIVPDSIIKDMERMMNSFWWGGGTNNKGIRWLAWDGMTHPKAQGGMGFRDLHTFNLALITKQGWNMMTKPNSLVAKLFKARYFPNSSLFESKIGGYEVKIAALFPLHVATRIVEIPLFETVEDDRLIWADSTDGHYNVRSSYKLMMNITGRSLDESMQEAWNSLWKILAPPKAKHFLWRVSKDCLPTQADSAKAAIHVVCATDSNETAGLFALLLWSLWSNRNNKVWNNVTEAGRNIGIKSRHMWEECLAVQNVKLGRQQHSTHRYNMKQAGRNLPMVGTNVTSTRDFIKSLARPVQLGVHAILWEDLH